MKKYIFGISLSILFACTNGNKTELSKINLRMLSKQLENSSNKDITTIYKNGKTFYINSNDSSLINAKCFDFGYPFIGKSAIIIENNLVGVINRKGNYIFKPQLKNIQFHEENEDMFFWNDYQNGFDLDQGIIAESWVSCTEYAFPNIYSFENKYNKFGIIKDETILIQPKYHKLIYINDNCIIAEKNNLFGVININEKVVEKFKYVDYSVSDTFSTDNKFFALKENNTWVYFKDGKKIFKSIYKCESFKTKLNNSIGIFTVNNYKNILFENGKTLNQYYSSISENGLIAVKEKKIFQLINRSENKLLFERK